MKYDFWDAWKNKTTIERKAIRSVKIARDLIIKSIPKEELVSIYIKGSFARREMKENSDIDIVPIVTENKYEGNVFSVNSSKISPAIIVPLSLWELKNNRLFTKSNHKPDLRAKPDRLLTHIKECKLIYGKPLNPKNFPVRSNKKALKDEIKIILNGYIPAYNNRRIMFSPLLKEVFWLVELEQKSKGENPKHSFEEIASSIKEKDHIIHQAIKFRREKLKGKKAEKKFINELISHLKKLKNN